MAATRVAGRSSVALLSVLFVCLASWLDARQAPPAPQGAAGRGGPGRGGVPPAPPDPAAVARGRGVVERNCVACHGADGRGGADRSADLSQSPIAIANDGGRQLIAFLKVGRPERRMPALAMADADVVDLNAYLRSIAPAGSGGRGAPISVAVVGDAAAGQAYFNAAGCTTCHSAAGDLRGIGSRLPVASIQGRLVMPRGSGGYPRSFLSLPDPGEAPRTVKVTAANGETVTGTLLFITDFWVTLVDGDGTRRTIARQGDTPAVEVTDPLAWHIDHMKRLTDKDMHDLTAYLVTLRE
jgi:cytochrome c oxidase cbb3-type subunit 3